MEDAITNLIAYAAAGVVLVYLTYVFIRAAILDALRTHEREKKKGG